MPIVSKDPAEPYVPVLLVWQETPWTNAVRFHQSSIEWGQCVELFNCFILEPLDLCGSAECGPNAECQNLHGKPICQCLIGFVPLPKPHLGCTKPLEAALCNPGPCGKHAKCEVDSTGAEKCYCIRGFTGNAYSGCKKIVQVVEDPCVPSPCGRNTICLPDKLNGETALCSCQNGFHGDPLSSSGCRPECEVPSDCLQSQTCISMKCVDVCR